MFSLARRLSWSTIKTIYSSALRNTHSKAHSPEQYIKKAGPSLEYFIYNSKSNDLAKENNNLSEITVEKHPYINTNVLDGTGKKGTYI